jgi:glycosyltransferase 2 family protein
LNPAPPPGATPTLEPAAPTSRRNLWLTLFTFGLAALLLYLALRGVDWKAFLETLRHGRYYLLPLIFLWGSTNYFIRAMRWRVLLTSERQIRPLTVFWANMAGYLGNSFLPARAGELVRSVALGHKAGINTSFVLATALTERLLDVVALVLISALALLALPGISPGLAPALRAMAVLGGVGLLVVLLAPRFSGFFQRLLGLLPIPVAWRPRLDNLLIRFLDGMRSLQHPGRALSFVALTGVIWLADGLGSMLGAYMLRLHLTLPQALLLLAGMGLSSAIPSTPGYVGVYQFAAVTVLTPFGFSKSDALAYILVAQAFGYVVVTVWGLPGLWLSRK